MGNSTIINTAYVMAAEAVPVEVEISINRGLPRFSIIGIKDAQVNELRTIISTAIKSAGFSFPAATIIVNVAPGSLSKTAEGLALPIAVGILAASRQIDPKLVCDTLFYGDLNLSGDVKAARGAISVAKCAADQKMMAVVANRDAFTTGDVRAYGMVDLSKLREEPFFSIMPPFASGYALGPAQDFADIVCPDNVKRAIQISIVSGCGLLMVGDDDQAMDIAKRIPSILPDMSHDEWLEVANIRSVSGEDLATSFLNKRPVRIPHFSATLPGLVGGGSPLLPGEVSLAHNGVLALLDIGEFKSSVLQALRQPLECGNVKITRAGGNYTLPADFILVAGTAPCPCGNLGSKTKVCTCSLEQIKRFQERCCGPLEDKLQINIALPEFSVNELLTPAPSSSSADLKAEVEKGLAFKVSREHREKEIADMPDATSIMGFHLDEDAVKALQDIANERCLSGRAMMNLATISRGIADLAEDDLIRSHHILEASSLIRC